MPKPKLGARPPLRLIDFAKQRRDADRRETLAILREMTGLVASDEATGVLLYFKCSSGRERFVCTGPFKADPALGVNAAAQITAQLLAIQDDPT
jgi:hypothetical protein